MSDRAIDTLMIVGVAVWAAVFALLAVAWVAS